jgi:exodeoxyribonuclease VII small subunit
MSETRPFDDAFRAAEPSFEEALAQLEEVVSRLETGDLALNDSLHQFEEGIRLSRYCARQLEEAEAKIELLIREEGQWQARPYEPELGSPG